MLKHCQRPTTITVPIARTASILPTNGGTQKKNFSFGHDNFLVLPFVT
ncbi:hypothetical protein DSUL_20074 [Desulfovibrionales bacterium]